MSELNLKIKSSIFNALVAVVCVISLSITILEELIHAILMLTSIAFFAAFLFGWLLSDWYRLIPGESFQYEPYVATVIISFPSALVSGVLYIGAMSLSSSISISEVLMVGALGGFMGAVFALPISLTLGMVLGWYLVNDQKL